MSNEGSDDLLREAEAPSRGLVGELTAFLRENRKWWLAPILVVLALVALLAILGSTAAAPFIYTLF